MNTIHIEYTELFEVDGLKNSILNSSKESSQVSLTRAAGSADRLKLWANLGRVYFNITTHLFSVI